MESNAWRFELIERLLKILQKPLQSQVFILFCGLATKGLLERIRQSRQAPGIWRAWLAVSTQCRRAYDCQASELIFSGTPSRKILFKEAAQIAAR